MNRTAVVYTSIHHKNTIKLLEKVKEEVDFDLISAEDACNHDLTLYDRLGLASGIYAFNMHKNLYKVVEEQEIPENIFIIYTSGIKKDDWAKDIIEKLKKKGKKIIAQFNCPGYDTFGPLKLVGGINKNRPDDSDIAKAVEFMKDNVI